MNQTYQRAAGIALITSAVALGVVGWPLAQQPGRYDATATIEVQRDQADLPDLTKVPGLAAGADNNYFIQTEIALLQSEVTLSTVITNLDLNHAWGRRLGDGRTLDFPETLQWLKARLQVQVGAEPSLINITAASDDAIEAAEIANATARAYCDYLVDYRRRLTLNALDAIAGQQGEMERSVAAAREKVQQTAQQLDPALREQAAGGPVGGESDTLRTLRAHFSEALLRYIVQSNQLARYQLQAAEGDENVAQLKARAEQAKAEMLAAESATREELRKQELLQNYRAARLELEDSLQRFAPLQKTVADLKNKLRPQGPASTQIVESASTPVTPDNREAARGRVLLVSGGVTFVLGVGLLMFPRKARTLPG